MQATTPKSERLSTDEPPDALHTEPTIQAFLDALNLVDGVHAGYPRDAADVCGKQGCQTTELLVALIIVGFGKLVVCPVHANEIIEREVKDGRDTV
jgi:hypothetical protein